MKNKKLFYSLVVFIVVVVLTTTFYFLNRNAGARGLEMYIFPLKSGSSILMRTPSDKRILIDGGAGAEMIREITKVLPFYSRHIDTLVVTDGEDRDVYGLIEVLQRYSPREIIVPAFLASTTVSNNFTDEVVQEKAYSILLDYAKQKNIQIKEVVAGDRLVFFEGESGNREVVERNRGPTSVGPTYLGRTSVEPIVARVLFPAPQEIFDYSKASAPQLVMNIYFGSTTVMLLGDTTPKIQKFIASLGTTSADVVVVSTNASPTNVNAQLINQSKPNFLVYSKSITNTSGKVSTSSKSKKEVIDPFEYLSSENKFNLKAGGTVKIVSDGETVKITQKP